MYASEPTAAAAASAAYACIRAIAQTCVIRTHTAATKARPAAVICIPIAIGSVVVVAGGSSSSSSSSPNRRGCHLPGIPEEQQSDPIRAAACPLPDSQLFPPPCTHTFASGTKDATGKEMRRCQKRLFSVIWNPRVNSILTRLGFLYA